MEMDHSKSSRESFRDLLQTISKNVYFQPPSNIRMMYPAIRYEIIRWADEYADNRRYIQRNEYLVTIIDRDPDSKLVEQMKDIPFARFDRQYVSNNLYHTVFTVKY